MEATTIRRRRLVRLAAGLFAGLNLFALTNVVLGAEHSAKHDAETDAGSLSFESERQDDPPGIFAARDNPLARSLSPAVVYGPYTSIQVNVDSMARNIMGDAATEPSIAMNPTNPLNMVIGWRQFNTVTSNFRQAGWAYTFDGGQHWTFPGSISAVFGSDPSLDADSSGTFYYQSLSLVGNAYHQLVYRSMNGGVSWLSGVAEYGGDKNWLAVDRSAGPSNGYVYGIWQPFSACCDVNTFTRSINGGASYQSPVVVTNSPRFGTMTVGPDGEVYVTGIDSTGDIYDMVHYVVAKSTNAGNSATSPTFTGGRVNLGGGLRTAFDGSPNPGGVLGQACVSVDPSSGAARGNVYVTSTVANVGNPDRSNVSFIRSVDGGASWSAPVTVNDDPPGATWHWFAAHSVSHNGRIDAIWYDTRNSGQTTLSQVFYAYSWDGGATWSPNVAVSPIFDTTLGYPPQMNRIGDYVTIVSDDTGGSVAYAATFNNEQDIYYLHVFPDCNGNGISDVTDIANATSADCDGNHVPDECQTNLVCGPSLAYTSTNAMTSCLAGGGGDGDNSLDPGEDAVLTLYLRNDGTVDLTHVAATLSTSTPGVTVTRASATYPNLPAHAVASSIAPHFAITVGTGLACGAVVDFTLAATADQGSWSRAFSVRVGRQAMTPSIVDSTDVPKTFYPPGGSSSVTISDPGSVAGLTVGVTLADNSDDSIIMTLIAPNGARRLLANGQGFGQENYTNTVFDDGAPDGIWNGSAPFTGPFRPEQSLSTLAGIPANGTWTLEIEKVSGFQAKLTAWSLQPTIAGGQVCNACALSPPALSPVALTWGPAGKTGLQWDSVPGATFYNVYRGEPADLPNLLSAAVDSCRRMSTTATATGDVLDELPPVGSFFWYLVRAGNGGGEGPAGDATQGPRSQESSGDCP